MNAVCTELASVRRSLVDADYTTIDGGSIHMLESITGGIARVEGNEAKATRASGVPVEDDSCINHTTRRGLVERSAQGLVGGVPRQIAHEQTGAFLSHD